MNKPLNIGAAFAALLLFLMPFGSAFAQCDSFAIEIPRNGIDEDCDNLDELYLTLPPHIYLLENQDFDFYFRNVFVSYHPQDYVCEIITPLGGTNLADRWQFTPTAADVGEHPLKMQVKAPNGTVLDEAECVVRVAAYGVADTTTVRPLFMLGHSFIDQGYMPAYMNKLVNRPQNPEVTYHGSRASWIDGTRYEALGGASWEYYHQNPESPYLFDSVFNMRAYLDSFLCVGCAPEWFVIHLDVNDFNFLGFLNCSDLDFVDDYIDTIYVKHISPFVNALRTEAPNSKIAISYTPPPNGRDSTFINFFGPQSVLSDRYRWQKISSRVTLKYTDYFKDREDENIWLLPIHLDIDDIVDFGPGDPVHPHPDVSTLEPPSGYLEIAKETYAWMLYTLNGTVSTKSLPLKTLQTVSVFPNPSSDALLLDASVDWASMERVQVFSFFGQVMPLQSSIYNGQLSIGHLPKGQYLLRALDGKGKVYQARFAKL